MELTMSMFATQADYWKARAELAERTVQETAKELDCEPEDILAAIYALHTALENSGNRHIYEAPPGMVFMPVADAKNAERYRWLRDAAWSEPLRFVIAHQQNAKWDAAIDEAMMLTPNAELRGRPLADGPA